MDVEKLAGKISDLLPDREDSINYEIENQRPDLTQKKAEAIIRKYTARELAKIKCREKAELKRLQRREELGIKPGRTEHQQRVIEEQEAMVATVEALEEQNKSLVPDLIKANMRTGITPKQASVLQTTTRKDVTKLLTSLNINLNLQLTKADTSNLLSCLLTCNETQLNALYNNKKIPIAIKTVIKRMLEDAKLGNMSTVESLWDRVFGKNGMSQEATTQQAQQAGLIPGTPISREAYIILRDTLIK